MINRAISWMGNSLTIGAATIATVNVEDFRLWSLAVVGVGATLWASWQKSKRERIATKTERYNSQHARNRLCRECIRSKIYPNNCVVDEEHKPESCPRKDSK